MNEFAEALQRITSLNCAVASAASEVDAEAKIQYVTLHY